MDADDRQDLELYCVQISNGTSALPFRNLEGERKNISRYHVS